MVMDSEIEHLFLYNYSIYLNAKNPDEKLLLVLTTLLLSD